MGALVALLACTIAGLLNGCVLGKPQSLPAIDLIGTILDETTGDPIPYALVTIVYHAPNPGQKNVVHGPFVADAEGKCRVVIEARTIWLSGGDAYVGGYLRGLEVKAPGYKDGRLHEGFNRGTLKNSGDFVLRLKQLENTKLKETTLKLPAPIRP